MKLDAVRQRNDAVRTRHEAKGGERQHAEERHDIHRRAAHHELDDDEEQDGADDKRLDDHARQLAQKEVASIGETEMLIVLLKLVEKVFLFAHDLRLFDRAQTLVDRLQIARGIAVLHLTGLHHAATKSAQEGEDERPHHTGDDDRRKGIGKDEHQPDGRSCDNLRQEL